MGVSSSLYSSISGLNTMGNAMSVLGDNIANVNTIAFKASRATFQDVLTQSIATAAGSAQIGRGVTLSTVDGIFAQGSFESTATATDMAIGGQGFFMLRAEGSAQADVYTRAGEFRFDQEGNLVNPAGHFVQGWNIESATGQITGTIGDINLGKSTPPVATTAIDVIVNVDSRETNETTEIRLFDAWNGTNAAQANPIEPIDAASFEYTSAIKVFDSKGASHDITIFFDRTTQENQWEFLITSDPSQDMRVLTAREEIIYAPNNTFNYKEHKGAGALMYGIIDFSTSGDISQIAAWNVPPDGKVDPALNTNRIVLDITDTYLSFPSNFTSALSNQMININFGARFSGSATSQAQIIVSDGGAFANLGMTNHITKETSWSTVFDGSGNQMSDGDAFTFSGYRNDGTAVSGSYTVNTAEKVQVLLDQLGNTFAAAATIDGYGRIRLTDNSGGDSGMFVTSFMTTSANNVTPFGGTVTGGTQINITTSKQKVIANDRAITTTDVPATATTAWENVYANDGTGPVANGNSIIFTGTKGDGTVITSAMGTYTVTDAALETMQDLLDFITATFDVDASIDGAGRLVLHDRIADSATYTSALNINIDMASTFPLIFGAETMPFRTIIADVDEDGSRMGDMITTNFHSEALASTQYANSSTTIFQDQDGFAAGFLQSVSVDTAGIITGNFSNGQVLRKAQVALASFNNLAGLHKEGGNLFRETTESGAPITGVPGSIGLGSIAPNSLEQSNVDLGTEFVKLITTQRGFQANSKIISTTDEMLSDLINIKR